MAEYDLIIVFPTPENDSSRSQSAPQRIVADNLGQAKTEAQSWIYKVQDARTVKFAILTDPEPPYAEVSRYDPKGFPRWTP